MQGDQRIRSLFAAKMAAAEAAARPDMLAATIAALTSERDAALQAHSELIESMQRDHLARERINRASKQKGRLNGILLQRWFVVAAKRLGHRRRFAIEPVRPRHRCIRRGRDLDRG
jgi:hypothetical protein